MGADQEGSSLEKGTFLKEGAYSNLCNDFNWKFVARMLWMTYNNSKLVRPVKAFPSICLIELLWRNLSNKLKQSIRYGECFVQLLIAQPAALVVLNHVKTIQ